jgi:hypothetical protein
MLEAGYSEDQAAREARQYGELMQMKADDFPEHCLFCAEELALPFIYWGGRCDIGLHPECAARLSLAINRDVIEYQRGRPFAQAWYTQAKAKAFGDESFWKKEGQELTKEGPKGP